MKNKRDTHQSKRDFHLSEKSRANVPNTSAPDAKQKTGPGVVRVRCRTKQVQHLPIERGLRLSVRACVCVCVCVGEMNDCKMSQNLNTH